MVIRILVADDHASGLASLRLMIASRDDWEIAAQASDGAEAVEKAMNVFPDIAVLDIQMPRMNGIQAARQILRFCPGTKVIAVSLHDQTPLMDELKKVGVLGFVPKARLASDLVPALDAVLQGGTWFKASEREN
ncbi:MAG TPA: response regulator transcription factor [Candidatus Acidoferrales bacterium]|jgi:DNA-binding NarL/FixJ family response regulator|nr:response regulator transcription factor [Candidatus Acidoferrales bacterium]